MGRPQDRPDKTTANRRTKPDFCCTENKKGNDETIYLRNVENVIKNKKTKAEITLENTIF